MICCRPCCAIISTFDVSGFFSSAARTRAAEFFVYWWMWVGGGVSPSNVLEVGPRRAALGRDWSPGLFAEKLPRLPVPRKSSEHGQGEDLVHQHLVLPGLPGLAQLLFQLFRPGKAVDEVEPVGFHAAHGTAGAAEQLRVAVVEII